MENYQPVEVLGSGTYGVVMKCLDKTTGQFVAVKKLIHAMDNRYHAKMLAREIRLLQALQHDHLMPIIGAFRYCRLMFLVFPLMQNNLFDYIEMKGGVFSLEETKECMYQVLKGLDHMHKMNILHRDLKPENVLVSQAGVVKICDFGLSRIFPPSGFLHLSPKMGTMWFMSPEMLMMEPLYSSAVDIWSVGVMFTELVEGIPMFTAKTAIGQLYSIFKVFGYGELGAILDKYLRKHGLSWRLPPRQPRDSYKYADGAAILRNYYEWPASLLEVVAHCLQINPEDRKSAGQLLDMEFFTSGMFATRFDNELRIRLSREVDARGIGESSTN